MGLHSTCLVQNVRDNAMPVPMQNGENRYAVYQIRGAVNNFAGKPGDVVAKNLYDMTATHQGREERWRESAAT